MLAFAYNPGHSGRADISRHSSCAPHTVAIVLHRDQLLLSLSVDQPGPHEGRVEQDRLLQTACKIFLVLILGEGNGEKEHKLTGHPSRRPPRSAVWGTC